MKNEVLEAIMMGANEINRLRNENKELQQRIVKAIEYIEKYELVSGYKKNDNYSNCNVKEQLLKILDKGE